MSRIEERAKAIDKKRAAGLLSTEEFMAAKLDLYYPQRRPSTAYVLVVLIIGIVLWVIA